MEPVNDPFSFDSLLSNQGLLVSQPFDMQDLQTSSMHQKSHAAHIDHDMQQPFSSQMPELAEDYYPRHDAASLALTQVMQCCVQLQQCSRLLEPGMVSGPGWPRAEILSVLSPCSSQTLSIMTACTISSSVAPSQAHAVAASVLAATLKITELCAEAVEAEQRHYSQLEVKDRLVEEFQDMSNLTTHHGLAGDATTHNDSRETSRTHDLVMDHVLTLNQIDFFLVQNWVCESRAIRHLDIPILPVGVRKRESLRRRIGALIQQATVGCPGL